MKFHNFNNLMEIVVQISEVVDKMKSFLTGDQPVFQPWDTLKLLARTRTRTRTRCIRSCVRVGRGRKGRKRGTMIEDWRKEKMSVREC